MKITIESYNQDLSKLEEYGVTLETLKYLTKEGCVIFCIQSILKDY